VDSISKQKDRLTPLAIKNFKRAGYYADGLGLYLQVLPTGAKTWIHRYMLNGKAREMGLGSLQDVTLAEARAKRNESRKLAREQGIDPITHRQQNKLANALVELKVISFDQCATAYIDAKSIEWKNAKHRQQWVTTLKQYASPVFGGQPVSEVTTDLVMKVLQPIWYAKTETASRLRGRIESILDWAKTSGYRTGENPARWDGHLDNLLPARNKAQPVKHQPALPYTEINAFLSALSAQQGAAKHALHLLILTATRTSEIIGARWDEIDFTTNTWTIPAARMKAGREHRIPLTRQAVAVIEGMQAFKLNDFVFPGRSGEKPMSNMSMLQLLERMKRKDITVHGFRSTFRDWAAHETNIPREIAEAALAHDVRTETEAAYQRGDFFNRRRKLMEAWAAYCERQPVVHSKNVRSIVKVAG
jgi:integrase